MSYKVKSLVYLICFICSIVLYAHMETSIDPAQHEEVQLVKTNGEELQQSDKNAL